MSAQTTKRIAVIGAGVLGAAIGYSLARSGSQVLILDAGQPAGGATGDAFAWIGLSASAADLEQAALRRFASAELDRLAEELTLPFALTRRGALSWSDARGNPDADLMIDPELRAHVRVLSTEGCAAREPHLRTPPRAAVLAETDGSVDPVALTRSLLSGALARGAEFVPDTRVHELVVTDGRVTGVRTAAGTVTVDEVVVAAGTGTTALLRSAGVHVPVVASPCILLRLRTSAPLINGIVSGPEFELRQADETTLLAAEDYLDDSVENGPEAVATRALATIRREIRGAEEATLESVRVGLRPIPEDGRPVLGRTGTPGLSVAVAHAGIALTAGIGTLLARELLEGIESDLLTTFRPSRFVEPDATPHP
ncbi:glycine/D-amino acid oxidase-like deaminating enzyme [Mycetocola sp. BIGb0189]|uniref:NAD(P)/FAD-dependent oxidoreductase n=1 Tax=Mycetocola sp. BIGb0189 TaxID=2940604 RepID=UPI0021691C3D|nr:FAD-dependent oxidoreductase [Mycetocola sp. BIGb0189]MCS4277358.1 glycine/D-amino acid oxidase-like deaminating enzyme [Mycetocola sp. BIGb0189]